MKRALRWIIQQIACWAIIVDATYFHNPYSTNVLKFIAWLAVIGQILLLITKDRKPHAARPVPEVVQDFIVLPQVVWLAAYAWFVIAALILIAHAAYCVSFEKKPQLKKSDPPLEGEYVEP